MLDLTLSDVEIRILGVLIEKEMSTPEYYPLSLNALLTGCNQKSNREPVVSYDEETVLPALDNLKNLRLVWQSDAGRVSKYEERFIHDRNLVNKEAAILCVLFLRGPQTAGELRSRTERMYRFETLEEIGDELSKLEDWGYVMKLPRQPGRKEHRYCHLLSGVPEQPEVIPATSTQPVVPADSLYREELEALKSELNEMKSEIAQLKDAFAAFKAQFE